MDVDVPLPSSPALSRTPEIFDRVSRPVIESFRCQVSYARREGIDILSNGVDTTRRCTSTVSIFPFGDVDARRILSTANAAASYPCVFLLEATLLGVRYCCRWTLIATVTGLTITGPRVMRLVICGASYSVLLVLVLVTLGDFFNRCIIDWQQSLIAEVVPTDALLTGNSH